MADKPSGLVGKEFIFEYGIDRILPPSEKTGGVFATEQRAYRRERVTRCRDCGFVRRDGDDICCARSLRLDERGVSRLSLVRLDGFCAWGEPREEA